jgi:succinate dehydrogenase / fumarate reductase cytochrome b subunit
MRRVVSLYRSSVGKKVLMAVTGVVLVGFVVAHMVGNLKMLFGCDAAAGACAMDVYAEWLREVGYPAVPHGAALWGFRSVLLLAVLVHLWAAWTLWRISHAARTEAYTKREDQSFSYASRTMRWGGAIVLLFVVYHILHFTTGQAHTDFEAGAVYRNFVIAFQSPLVWGVYLIAQAALCFHLYHGVWSVFQTLGANHPRYNPMRRPFAVTVALVVFVGFMTPPTLVLAGVIA